MAITVGTGASNKSQTPATSITVSITAPAGSDRMVLVGVNYYGAAPTGVTYGGVAMTQIGSEVALSSDTNRKLTLWRLTQAAGALAGANNAVATFATARDEQWIGGAGFTGVDQTTPNDTVGTANGTTSPITQNVTSATGDLVVDFFVLAHSGGGGSVTIDAGQTSIVTDSAWGNTVPSNGMSYEAGAGTVTMSWTAAVVASWGQFAVNVNVAAGGAVTPLTFTGTDSLAGGELL